MAVHAFGDRPATGTGSSWGGCTGGDPHIVSHSDLLNNQVGKVCNYGHRLALIWERVLSEGSLLSLSLPHVSSSSLRKNHNMLQLKFAPPVNLGIAWLIGKNLADRAGSA